MRARSRTRNGHRWVFDHAGVPATAPIHTSASPKHSAFLKDRSLGQSLSLSGLRRRGQKVRTGIGGGLMEAVTPQPNARHPSRMFPLVLITAALLALTAASCGDNNEEAGGMQRGGEMEGMEEVDAPRIPPVFGYYDGTDIAFVHPEASDEQVAEMLTTMMDSPVLVVPALGDVPDSVLSEVYVFANGVRPRDHRGPFGFQPDVFANAPGDGEYTPLRRVVRVTWVNERDAEELRSEAEIVAAEQKERLTLERTDAVVNMPFLTWPDGSR